MKPPELDGVILGAVLKSTDAKAFVESSGHHEADFFDPRVRTLWGEIEKLVARRRPVDAFALFSACKTAGKLVEDDLAWLIGLQANSSITAQSFYSVAEDHLRAVRGLRVAAHLEKLAATTRQNGLEPAKLGGALEGITRQLASDYVPDRNASGDVVEILEDWDRRLRGETVGAPIYVPTGVKILDSALKGWAPNLNILLGDPGVGKSGVAGSCIEAGLGAGKCIGGFFLEEGSRWLSRRLIAKGLGMAVGDVGSAVRTIEQSEKLAELGQALTSALERLQVYTYEDLEVDELIRRARHWVLQFNINELWIDHLAEIRHRMPHPKMFYKHNEAVAFTCKRLRDFAKSTGVPVILLAHRTSDRAVRSRKGPPLPSDVGLTGEAEKMARRMVGLWLKGEALRFTVLKNNDGKPDVTGEFARHFDAALIDIDGGRMVNLEQEQREEREEREAQGEEKKRARDLARAEYMAAEKAKLKAKNAEAVAAALPPQLELVPVKP